jgi:hypothetical protein
MNAEAWNGYLRKVWSTRQESDKISLMFAKLLENLPDYGKSSAECLADRNRARMDIATTLEVAQSAWRGVENAISKVDLGSKNDDLGSDALKKLIIQTQGFQIALEPFHTELCYDLSRTWCSHHEALCGGSHPDPSAQSSGRHQQPRCSGLKWALDSIHEEFMGLTEAETDVLRVADELQETLRHVVRHAFHPIEMMREDIGSIQTHRTEGSTMGPQDSELGNHSRRFSGSLASTGSTGSLAEKPGSESAKSL